MSLSDGIDEIRLDDQIFVGRSGQGRYHFLKDYNRL